MTFDDNSEPTFKDVIETLTTAEKSLIDQVCILFQLMQVIPATNAVSERSFAA